MAGCGRRGHGGTPRLAAGRARALGLPTRGTTNPNRLRRMDNWICAVLGPALRAAADPLVVDLGYGATPVTAIELVSRLRRVRPDVRVLGLEIDAARVAAALPAADPPSLTFALGGFELAGQRPALVRAANVLRQYDEPAALAAWTTLCAGLAAGRVAGRGHVRRAGPARRLGAARRRPARDRSPWRAGWTGCPARPNWPNGCPRR